MIRIFTDGACSGNPGPGGWGVIIEKQGIVTELGGADSATTNNRMEMTAAIEALKAVGASTGEIVVYTDSTYLINGITKWVAGWQRRGWKTATGDPVLNRELWEALAAIALGKKIKWEYVKGHSGHPANDRVDQIAVGFSVGTALDLYKGPLEKYPCDLDGTSTLVGAGKGKEKSGKGKKPGYYLSLVGGKVGRHMTWAECEARTKGVSGAKFIKVHSASDEAAVLSAWGVG